MLGTKCHPVSALSAWWRPVVAPKASSHICAFHPLYLTAAAFGCEDASPIKEKCYPRNHHLRGRLSLRAHLRSCGPQLPVRLANTGRVYSPARIRGMEPDDGLDWPAIVGPRRLPDRCWHLVDVRAKLVAPRSRRSFAGAADPGRVAHLCGERQTVGARQVGLAVAALVEGVRPELRAA